MPLKSNTNRNYKLDIELIKPCHYAYAKLHQEAIKKFPRKKGEPSRVVYPEGYDRNKRKKLLALIKNINTNRTACAVHKALSRDISRLSADEAIYRASRCSWHDIWQGIKVGSPAFMIAAWRNPRVSRGQQDVIWENLPEELLLIAF